MDNDITNSFVVIWALVGSQELRWSLFFKTEQLRIILNYKKYGSRSKSETHY